MRKSIARAILVLRGHRVLLDVELAALYGVTTKRLNEQVKRNAARFPADFIFRLTNTETVVLNRSKNATGSVKHRDPHRKYSPYVAETISLRSQFATLRTGRVRNIEVCT
jgi:ORF6N domain